MTRVKICGIKEAHHAVAAVEAGADLIGLVFAPSTRRVSPARAQEIAAAVRSSGGTAKLVGVFVNAHASEVGRIADLCALDWIQLSGDETVEYCVELGRPIIRSIRVGRQSPADLCAEIAAASELIGPHGFLTLLDAYVENRYGGTGIGFDRAIAARVAERFPTIVAGGLTPDNVGRLVEHVAPWGVDVSSGVETDGAKDVAKIEAFVQAVRNAARSGTPGNTARGATC